MATKWRVDILGCSVEQIEVVAETAHFLTIRTKNDWFRGGDRTSDRREKKDGKVFDTFEEAKAALVAYLERCSKHAELELRRTLEKIQKVNAMQNPLSE